MARRTKRNAALVKQIVALLEDGNTDLDTCALVGISTETFYTWIEKFPDFSDTVTRARGIARQRAVDAYRSAMKESQSKTTSIKTFTETRLDRAGKAYEYKRVTTEKQLVENAPDWRAAESYLKRRDPANWAETFIIKVTPEQAEILKRHGLSAGEAFEKLIQRLANADAR